ncbi:MAG: energy-coupling factor transporter transmembrane protein EcfT [Lachnospiraceae bacterium]|nr:energy-coupling factor transporter transmembrane protein EcfT [Lachnospiraceae bacterium]
MLRDITLGQYYPTDSVIHRLDPRVKLTATLLFIVSMFLFHSFLGYAVAGICLAVVIVISHVPFRFMMKGLKTIWFLLIFTMIFNIFLTDGTILFQWKFIKISQEGLLTAAFMGLRLFFLIIGSSLMTLTTTPNQLTTGMETGLRWMKVIHVPVHEIAMMMSIALRFIPILMEETDKIMKAQQARGADFEEGKLMDRVRALVPVFVPLFVSAFRRANELAMAMEARCYRGDNGRTSMKPLKYAARDGIAYVIMVLFLVLIVFTDKIAALIF